MLELAGWSVQDVKDLDFTTSRGVALREFPLTAGFADYMLFVDRQAVGIVEAKKEGTTLAGWMPSRRNTSTGSPPTSRGSRHHCLLPTRARAWRRCSATCEIPTSAPGGCSGSTGRERSWGGRVSRRRFGHASRRCRHGQRPVCESAKSRPYRGSSTRSPRTGRAP
jgi:hypothetical protein